MDVTTANATTANNEKQHKKSIAQRKFDEYMEERELLLQAELGKKFKANPIPASSLVAKSHPGKSVTGSVSAGAIAEQQQQQQQEPLAATTTNIGGSTSTVRGGPSAGASAGPGDCTTEDPPQQQSSLPLLTLVPQPTQPTTTTATPRSPRQRARTTDGLRITHDTSSSTLFLSQTDPAHMRQKLFRAKAVPREVLEGPTTGVGGGARGDGAVNMGVDQLEQQRKERIRERARQLLAASALPSRMARGKEQEEQDEMQQEQDHHGTTKTPLKRKKKKCRCPEDTSCTFRPKIKSEVPDYKKLQAQFARELAERRRKLGHRVVSEPFHLSDSQKLSASTAVAATVATTIAAVATSATPGTTVATPSTTTTTPSTTTKEPRPPRDTVSARLKRECLERRREERVAAEERVRQAHHQRHQRLQQLSLKIRNALHHEDRRREEARHMRLRSSQSQSHQATGTPATTQFAHTTRLYQQRLREMNERLDRQPCMFERLQIESAQRRAHHVYETALEKCGVSAKSLEKVANQVASSSSAAADAPASAPAPVSVANEDEQV